MIDDGNPRAFLSVVREYQADILIAGGRNMYTALKAKLPFLDINQEREFGYEGYDGHDRTGPPASPDAGKPGLGGGDAADAVGTGGPAIIPATRRRSCLRKRTMT